MTLTPENPVLSIPQPEFKAGKPKAPKLTEPSQVRSEWLADWQADQSNRLSRAYVQGMAEGKPPYDPVKMKQANLAGCCNIDWRRGQRIIRQKMEPYVLMLNSLPVFLSIKTKHGREQDRVNWERIMSETHSRILRSWESFTPRHLYNAQYLVCHGASFCYFNDDKDWRWQVSTMGEMVIPRLTKADSSEFSRMSMERDYEPSYLWEQIKEAVANKHEWTNPEDKTGWHVPSVKEAICKATYKEFFKTDDWERNEVLWKNKEITYSESNKVCPAILRWGMEDDGSVTQYIASKTELKVDKKKEEFLYKLPRHFSALRQGVVTFTRDIGTNGYFHSIRGTGSDIFPMIQELNKLECAAYDALKLEMSIFITAPQEVWQTEMGFVQAGPFTFIHDQVKIPSGRVAANYSNSVYPGMETLKQNLHEQAGIPQGPEQPGNKVDLMDQLANMTGIGVMEYTLFYNPWQRLLRESLRRLIALKNTLQPGGREAEEFRRLCYEQGVPKQAIDSIDIEACEAIRAIGSGSPQAYMFTMAQMEGVVPFMDEEGRSNWVRDKIASLPGMHWRNVDRYAPPVADMRPSQQVRNARSENVDLKMMGISGGIIDEEDVSVLPNDDHIVHLEWHAPAIERIVAKVQSGQMLIEEAVRPIFPLYLHSTQHLELLGDNPVMQAQVAAFRQAMQNAGEIITNGQRKLQKQQEQQMEDQGQNGEGEPRIYPDPLGTGAMLTPSEMLLMTKAQVNLQNAARNAARADQIHDIKVGELREQALEKKRNSMQKRQITDLKAAASLQS